MTPIRTLPRILLLLLVFTVASCGGGGSSSRAPAPAPAPTPEPEPTPEPDPDPDPDPDPTEFGLTQRASLATFEFPDPNVSSNAFSRVMAYPNLLFSSPIFIAGVPGTDRLVVVEQGGRVLAFDDDEAVNTTREVLNVSGRIVCCGEEGLLGLAFDPAFTQNGYLYVHYIESGPRRSKITRFTWDPATDLIDPASEKIILEVEQPFSNHNSGMLAFGPDDYLYIGMGDGGQGDEPLNHGQNRNTLLGSMLRIDVHPDNPTDPYDVPLDNPLVGVPDTRAELFAWGLRNPWRFSFDRQTGDLLVGDVGQREIEEIDHVVAGGNYGWRVFEGTRENIRAGNTLPDSAFTPPVIEYNHSQGLAVTGGYVYRGTRVAALFGRYLYADYLSGTVWAFDWDGTSASNNQAISDALLPSSFGEKNDGEVLLVSYNGRIFRFEDNDGGGEIPTLLSQTGLFTDLVNLTPASGLIEYTVRHPFYSDGANKRRWVGVPDGTQVDFSNDDWEFPIGTVVVKHFTINMTDGDNNSARRLETRVLVHAPQGWTGFTYRWNASESDADLMNARETENLTIALAGGGTREQLYEYPSRTDCLVCHTQTAGHTLGLKTPQLNTSFDYSGIVDNQLRSWNNIDLFNSDIGDTDQYDQIAAIDDATASLDERARAYLDVNCSNCHRPNGPTGTSLDLRAEAVDMNAIGISPLAGDLGISNALIIASGERERSTLWQRMQRVDSQRMPPLGSHRPDDAGIALIGDWIDSL